MDDLPNLRIFFQNSKSPTDIDNDATRLAALLEWCKIVRSCLESGQIQEAKFFLAQAIAEAEKH